MVVATTGELAAPEHPIALHKWAVSYGAGGVFSTFKLWGVEPHGAAFRGLVCRTRAAERDAGGLFGRLSYGGCSLTSTWVCSLAALHWLWVPLRGSCPAGGDRQRLRFPAGAFQSPAQLPQPRVLPWEADVERGESGLRRADGLDGATPFTPGFGLARGRAVAKLRFFCLVFW